MNFDDLVKSKIPPAPAGPSPWPSPIKGEGTFLTFYQIIKIPPPKITVQTFDTVKQMVEIINQF